LQQLLLPKKLTSPVYSGFGSAHTYQVIGASRAYRFGSATIGAMYSNIQFLQLGDTANSGVNCLGGTLERRSSKAAKARRALQ
jgi:hypothetical protein